MRDVENKAKKAVLEEIMAMLDGNMGEALKSKSPKFMKAELEAEVIPEESVEEMPPSDMMESDEMPDDDKARLKELYEKFC